MLTDAENKERRDAYDQTESDADAAKLVQIEEHTFRAWRLGKGLPAKQPQFGNGRGLDPERQTKRQKLYEEGLTDPQIAEALGIPVKSVGDWRRKYKLPVNVPPEPETVQSGFREVRTCKGPCREKFICRDPKHVKCEFCR
jgi:hypothetical protein